ncbi:MAG: EAL domain-containing protein [Parvularcula sp.]
MPTFGIDGYATRVARLMAEAPREMPIVEGVVLAGLAAVAGLLIVVALFRRSAVAAVGFSFLALIGLVCALLFGRLSFVPEPTQILLLCLAACAMLLFVTATIRVARDNPLIGVLVLVGLAALLVIGVASGAGVVDGGPLMRLGLAATFGLTSLCLLVEVIRRDRASLIVAPGLVAIMASPVAMSMVANSAAGSWLAVAAPIMLLAAGGVYAAVAALAVLSFGGEGAAEAGATHPVSPTMTPMVATPTAAFQEVADEPLPVAPMMQEVTTAEDAPAMTAGPISQVDEPHAHPEPVRHDYAAAPQSPTPHPPALNDAAEPVSAQWGRKDADAGFGPLVANDEYVWDQMAEQEVKAGDGFLGLFGVAEGRDASPDQLRNSVAPGSLGEFDDQILGGSQPVTGRFDVELAMVDGARIRVEGRRQVDPDGILTRLEATGQELAAAPIQPAPMSAAPKSALAASAAPLAATRRNGRRSDAQDLLTAFDAGEIRAHFQPIVRLADRVTVGFEALARWHQQDGTVVEAGDFVPELIKKGKGLELVSLIVGQAARELADWIAAEPGQGQFVSVNIAASDLPRDELATIIKDAVSTYALPAGALVVELTEGRIKASQSKALAAAKSVRQAGASLAIDDFGVGYSTLGRLTKFNFDLIKTDRSLIADLSGKKARRFMKTLLATAHKQGAPVIAEGVEDEETAAILTEMGCEFAQGFLFGRAEPLGADEAAPEVGQDPSGVGPNSAVEGLR